MCSSAELYKSLTRGCEYKRLICVGGVILYYIIIILNCVFAVGRNRTACVKIRVGKIHILLPFILVCACVSECRVLSITRVYIAFNKPSTSAHCVSCTRFNDALNCVQSNTFCIYRYIIL